MLKNGGFEGIDKPGEWTRNTHDGVAYGEIAVPIGWTAFWREGDYRRPEMKVIPRQAPFLDPARIHSGDWAVQAFTFYGRMHAGLYQAVDGLMPGAEYEFTVQAHAWSTTPPLTGHDDAHCSAGVGCGPVYLLPGDVPPLNKEPENDAIGNFLFQVGVSFGDPDPFGNSVFWCTGAHIYNQFAAVPPIRFTAQANGKAVVYIRAISLWKFRTSDIYLDDATLVQVADEPPTYDCVTLVLPQDATREQLDEILDLAYPDRRTFCFSNDDSGRLGGKTYLYNIPQADRQRYLDWYADRYPRTQVEFAHTSDWDNGGILLGQCDAPWGPQRYGDGGGPTYCAKGCWLADCAMCLRYLNLDAEATPLTVDAAVGPDGYDADYAMLWSAMPKAGLEVLDSTTDADIARAHLDMGYVCFAEVLPVSLRHFVMVTRYEGDRYWMYDPWKRVVGWLDEKYSDVESWRMIQPAEEPTPLPQGNVISLHLQTMDVGWDTYLRDAKPNVIKVLASMHDVVGVKRVSPEMAVVWRHVDNNYDGILDAADPHVGARRWIAKFKDSLYARCAEIERDCPDVKPPFFYVESINEVYPSENAAAVTRAVNFDIALIKELDALNLPVKAVVFTAGIGNPHESEYELLVPMARVAEQYGALLGYHCFSDDTDILTEDGWIPIADFVEDRLNIPVATLNKTTNEVEYQLPTEYFAYDYDGKMLHTTGKIDVMVTPNHRMWIRSPHKAQDAADDFSRFEFVEAQDLPQQFEFKRDLPNFNGTPREFFELPAYQPTRRCKSGARCACSRFYPPRSIPMEDWLAFFGYWIADGHVSKNDVGITQNPGDTRKHIEEVLTRCGFEYSAYGYNALGIRRSAQLRTYLQQFGHAKDKFLPRWMLNLSRQQMRVLLGTMMAGDGTWETQEQGEGGVYCTVSPQLAEDFQELALKVGFTATLSQHCDGYYYVTIGSERRTPQTHQKYTEWIQYQGKVYCVSVPNGLLFVRRNGKPSWQGNSYFWVNHGVSHLDSDWIWHAGRWTEMDEVFVQHGVHVTWFGAESGAHFSCVDGWRAPTCFDGDWDAYEANLIHLRDKIAQWNAGHGNRFLGLALFSTGLGLGWDSWHIGHVEMEKLARALTS